MMRLPFPAEVKKTNLSQGWMLEVKSLKTYLRFPKVFQDKTHYINKYCAGN